MSNNIRFQRYSHDIHQDSSYLHMLPIQESMFSMTLIQWILEQVLQFTRIHKSRVNFAHRWKGIIVRNRFKTGLKIKYFHRS